MGSSLKHRLSVTLEWAWEHKEAIALTGIPTAIIAVGLKAQNYLVGLVPPNSELLTVRVIIALVLALFFNLCTYFWFKPKLVVSQKDGGCWLDEKTGIRYCVSCKTKFNQLVPLTEESKKWYCNVNGCYTRYVKKA